MKASTLFICAAIIATSCASNEPVASPTAEIERELAAFERQLGTNIPGTPTTSPRRPSGVSFPFVIALFLTDLADDPPLDALLSDFCIDEHLPQPDYIF